MPSSVEPLELGHRRVRRRYEQRDSSVTGGSRVAREAVRSPAILRLRLYPDRLDGVRRSVPPDGEVTRDGTRLGRHRVVRGELAPRLVFRPLEDERAGWRPGQTLVEQLAHTVTQRLACQSTHGDRAEPTRQNIVE
jgi:hypothetical protein